MQQAWSDFLTPVSSRDWGPGIRGGGGFSWVEARIQVLPGGKVRCLRRTEGTPGIKRPHRSPPLESAVGALGVRSAH